MDAYINGGKPDSLLGPMSPVRVRHGSTHTPGDRNRVIKLGVEGSCRAGSTRKLQATELTLARDIDIVRVRITAAGRRAIED
jgi:hypothetical protein